MGRVAIVTDSASDLTAEVAGARGIRVVPLYIRFGDEESRVGIEMSTEQFWARMLAPDAPFPTTAAASPGDFRAAFEAELDGGADAIVCVTVGGQLSATVKSAELAAQELSTEEIHVVDSDSASMGTGILALLAAEMAEAEVPAAEIAAEVRARARDIDLYVALDTLEYLRKGGRVSPARAAIGTVLLVKPIITVTDGLVAMAEKPRTRAKARERVTELLGARPVEWICILHTPTADVGAFRDEVLARLPSEVEPGHVMTAVVGPSVGPHIGPSCLGGVVLLRR